jgi:hypothetical protein
VGATIVGIAVGVTLGIAVGGGTVWLWQAARRRPSIKKMENADSFIAVLCSLDYIIPI